MPISRVTAIAAHIIVVVGSIALMTGIVFCISDSIFDSPLPGVAFYSAAIPAWLIVELIRWINRRDKGRYAKRPPDSP
jgi:hypothetical protein